MAYHDKREFDKYLKYLTQKVLQIIVESREGTKKRTRCSPSDTEWFNLALPERRDIINQLKRDTDVPYPQHNLPINITINFETSEGDTFPIEIWHLSIDTTKRDVTVSISHSLYPRFSILLKSLLSLSRVIPAYQLSRKNQDLKFNYIVSSGSHENLVINNTDVQNVTLGEVASPFGTISLSVEYKTTFIRHEKNPVTAVSESSLNARDSFYSSLTQSPGIHYPFATVLPKPLSNETQSLSSAGTSPLVADSSLTAVDRQSSDEINSVTVHSNQDGYLVLDLQEMRPAFGSSHQADQGLTDLLYLSNDPPFLDMFSDGTDINAAFNYLDKQQNAALKTS